MINDLFTSHAARMISYADDTTVLFEGMDPPKIKDEINSTMKQVASWPHADRLKLNIQKTKFSCFSNRPEYCIEGIEIDNVPLERCSHYKILGLTLDESLNFKLHINKIRKNFHIVLMHSIN